MKKYFFSLLFSSLLAGTSLTTLATSSGQVIGLDQFASASYRDDMNAALTNLLSNEMVIIDFYKPTCGHCQRFAPTFEKVARNPNYSSIVFVKIDVDDPKAGQITQKYGIRGVPSIKFFKNGAPLSNSDFVGNKAEAGFKATIKKAFGV